MTRQIQFSEADQQQLAERGISPAMAAAQLEMYRQGIPPIQLVRACDLDDGIRKLAIENYAYLARNHANTVNSGGVVKFVPASGAATRLVEHLLQFSHNDRLDLDELELLVKQNDKSAQSVWTFFQNINSFAFYLELKSVLSFHGFDIEKLLTGKQVKPILDYLLTEKGMNYANLPKGLITFHKYGNHTRTPLEEHIIEGLEYVQDSQRTVHLHFTVPEAFRKQIERHLRNFIAQYEKRGVSFDLTFSIQKPHTDIIAVDQNNEPFRDERGRLVFRPGGHGALLDNLNDLDADIVFIKNVDNVAPDHLKLPTYRYKRILCGYLVEIQQQIFNYLKLLEDAKLNSKKITEIRDFAAQTLSTHFPDHWDTLVNSDKREYLYRKLNRPLRICGMVKTHETRGGGPFWVRDSGGNVSLQIVEMAQVDQQDENQKRILDSARYFNPVDLVCGIRDFKGQPFNLHDFKDPQADFITTKSFNGRLLKALEHPGLWNGSMAYWNTIFVEVPISTFTPVKYLNDLLSSDHQGL